ncbi:helix-turn-helix transcriptional regulator [Clostridia bacterium OttesenSCG-928-F22]|nr:helix-turn-helix transcriptional regulator [Clostridia bacterium OttesenSCG-928-F22]
MPDKIDYGYFEITLNEYLSVHNISKNTLADKANLQRTQLNNYCKNDIKRPDFDVLARICYALDCELADIVRYVKPEKTQGGQDDGSIK